MVAKGCYCLVRVAATGSGTTPITYKILAAYSTEAAATEALEALPDTPRVRHYVDAVPINPTRARSK